MQSSLYKDAVVQRGHTYRYYWSPPAPGKPTLLFVHGFPSTAADWRKQVAFFQPLGYGILAPDLLGAGGTAKPMDAREFRMNAMARDVVDLLDAENLDKVIGLSHDWGSPLLSRLAVLFPERFIAYVWFAVAFLPPVAAPFSLEATMARFKGLLGYETYAYWQFFLREDASRVIQEHADSFTQLLYANKPDAWLKHMVRPGKTAECLECDVRHGHPSYLTDEEYAAVRDRVKNEGLDSALNWYRAQVANVNLEDNAQIPQERLKLQVPSFVVLAAGDHVCVPKVARAAMEKHGSDVEYFEVQSGHWPHLEHPESVNVALRGWLESKGW
ncbi:alpha/beta-hydrolase [Trametes polyzona]|nr:alpha/beta-hydrolase [Trametes polyzona]